MCIYIYIHILYIYIYMYVCIYIYIYIYIYASCRAFALPRPAGVQHPATWKHGWSEHGSSIIPSSHSIPQDLKSPRFNFINYARTMFNQTTCSRRRLTIPGYTWHVYAITCNVFTVVDYHGHNSAYDILTLYSDTFIYIYIYISMYICIYTYTHLHVHTYLYIYIYRER